MKSVLPVKMLSALALVLLVFSATEGRILSKCELKAQLEAGLGGNQGGSGPGSVTSGVGAVTGGVVGNDTGSGPGNGTGSGPGSVTSGVGDVTGGVVGNDTGSGPGNGTGSLPGSVTSGVVAMAGGVVGNGTTPGNANVDLGLIAKIVCSVERVSKFNTNLVHAIGSPADSRPRPAQRPNERTGERPGQGRPGRRGKRSPGHGKDRNPSSKFGDSSEEDSSKEVAKKLFGIFQLSDRRACDSGSGQSLNICRMNCSALIDDDIRDDITCLKTLLDRVTNEKHMLFVKECSNVYPLQYFAECV